jgi:hypothetical protein
VEVVARRVPIRTGQKEKKRGEGMRVGHTARSDHSGHDLPHTEVRVRRAATSKKKKGSERRWEAALGLRKEKKFLLLFC